MKINFIEGMNLSREQDVLLMKNYPFVWLIQYIYGIIILVCFFFAGYGIAVLK